MPADQNGFGGASKQAGFSERRKICGPTSTFWDPLKRRNTGSKY